MDQNQQNCLSNEQLQQEFQQQLQKMIQNQNSLQAAPENSSSKQKRRTRNDNDERNFTCGCGKKYLSYPALYTHMKQKHQGKPPNGTYLPTSQSKSNRGRPKQNAEKSDDSKFTSPFENQYVMNEIVQFLETLDSSFNRQQINQQTISNNNNNSNLNNSNNQQQIVQSSVEQEENSEMSGGNISQDNTIVSLIPETWFKEESDYLPIKKNLNIIVNSNQLNEEKNENQIKQTKINKILSVFIYFLHKHISDEAMKELILFVCLYRKALNKYGYEAVKQLLRKNKVQQKNDDQYNNNNENNQDDNNFNNRENNNSLTQGNEEQKNVKKEQSQDNEEVQQNMEELTDNLEFCEEQNGQHSLLICNDFIIDFLPEFIDQMDKEIVQNLKIVGRTDEKLKNAVYLIQNLGNWLFANKYTNNKLLLRLDDVQNND